MKHRLAQFNISEALRRRTALPRFWRTRVDNDPQLADFERDARRLDRRMRAAARAWPASAPEDLAPAILRSIRNTAPPPRPERSVPSMRWWMPATACALLVMAAVWWTRLPGSNQAPTVAAAPPLPGILAEGSVPEALSAGTLLAGMGLYPPGAIADPLSAQLEAASEDARAAARFLVASLP